MKRKRLDRDGWGFQGFPYAQMRLEHGDFRGRVCLIRLVSGEACCWELPRAGRVAVCGAGMTWMTLIPDGTRHILTVKFRPDGRVALWYADMIDRVEEDPDGVWAFVDQYLDVIFTPQGDVKLDDLDELLAAWRSGELPLRTCLRAWWESLRIRAGYCLHPARTETWCRDLPEAALARWDGAETFRKTVRGEMQEPGSETAFPCGKNLS